MTFKQRVFHIADCSIAMAGYALLYAFFIPLYRIALVPWYRLEKTPPAKLAKWITRHYERAKLNVGPAWRSLTASVSPSW